MGEEAYGIAELFAVCIRKCKRILIVALIAAVILGLYGAMRSAKQAQRSAADAAEHYEEALEAYADEVERIEAEIEMKEAALAELEAAAEALEEEESKTLLAILKSDCTYEAYAHILIDEIDEAGYALQFAESVTPRDYLNGLIQNRYLLLWEPKTLLSDDVLLKYPKITSENVGSFVRLSVDYGILTVHATGATQAMANDLVAAGFRYVESLQSKVEETSYCHTLTVFDKDVVLEENQELKDLRETYRSDYESIQNEIDTCTLALMDFRNAISDLEQPEAETTTDSGHAAVKGGIKFGVAGFCAGAVCMALLVMILAVARGEFVSSYQIARITGLNYLGITACQQHLFQRLAIETAGGYVPADKNEAGLQIQSAVSYFAGDAKTVLVASLEGEGSAEELKHILETMGLKVTTVSNADRNGSFLTALPQNETVVLTVGVHTARYQRIHQIQGYAGSKLIGFIMI